VGVVDPAQTSTALLETSGKLSFDVANANAELTEALRGSPQSPQVATLRNRISALEGQIAREKIRIGGTSEALAPIIADYERLVLEREFADRAFASALTSLEVARMEAQRQQLYLERIVEPRAADYARRPYRLLMIAAVFGVSFAAFMILTRLLANARAHRPL
jgi:capsular polysaccharide transport system permease protein